MQTQVTAQSMPHTSHNLLPSWLENGLSSAIKLVAEEKAAELKKKMLAEFDKLLADTVASVAVEVSRKITVRYPGNEVVISIALGDIAKGTET